MSDTKDRARETGPRKFAYNIEAAREREMHLYDLPQYLWGIYLQLGHWTILTVINKDTFLIGDSRNRKNSNNNPLAIVRMSHETTS